MGWKHKLSGPKVNIPPALHQAAQHAAQGAHAAGKVVAAGVHHAEKVVAQGTHHAGKVIADGAHHAGKVIADGAHHAGKVIADGAHHAGKVIADGAHHAGKVVAEGSHHGGKVAAQTVHHWEEAVGSPCLFRPLTSDEMQVADSVFKGTVPLHRVLLSPQEGLGARPFTIPGSLFVTISALINVYVAAAELLRGLGDKYIILIGPQGYDDALNHPFDTLRAGQTLIHELTHVWQGCHSTIQWTYVMQSCCSQLASDWFGYSNPYNINSKVQGHPPWRQFEVEQQARLVENWYARQLPEIEIQEFHRDPSSGQPDYSNPWKWSGGDDPTFPKNVYNFYPYIRDNVRAGSNGAQTSFAKESDPNSLTPPGAQ